MCGCAPRIKSEGRLRRMFFVRAYPRETQECKFACNNDPLRGGFRVQ